MDLRDLAGLAAEIYERSRSELPDEDPARAFEDRAVRLVTTFQGAGVLTRGPDPGVRRDRQRRAGRAVRPGRRRGRPHAGAAVPRRAAGGACAGWSASDLLPERAGQPVKAWAHMSLADLLRLDGSSALQEEWTAQVRAQWAAHRAEASEGGGDGGAWLDGDAAEAIACDAAMAPVVTGDVNVGRAGGPGPAVRRTRQAPPRRRRRTRPPAATRTRPPAASPARPACPARPARPGKRSSGPSSARPSTCCPAPAGWRRSCAAGSSAPASAAPACRWTSAYSETVPAGIRHAVLLRDRHCQWAGRCDQPAAACEVHHTKHKANGGKTSVKDCVLLCWFHHQVVIHRWGWTLVLNPDGTTTAWNKDKTKILHSHGPPARAG